MWDSRSGQLLRTLCHHRQQVHVLRQHPIDWRVVLAADSAGAIVLWDWRTQMRLAMTRVSIGVSDLI